MRKVRKLRGKLAVAAAAFLYARIWSMLVLFAAAATLRAQSAGEFSFAAARFAVSEADGTAFVVVTRDSDYGMMLIDFIVEDDTATNGVHFDYSPATNTLVFRHFQSAVTVPIQILDNNATSTVTQVAASLSLANPRPAPGESPELTSAISATNPTSQLVILDNDRELQFNLEKTWFPVQEPAHPAPPATNASTSFTVNVVLVAPPGDTSQGVEVDYSITTGSATRPGSDFASASADFEEVQSGTLSFGPNDTSQSISVTIYSDDILEFNEDFHVRLTAARGTRSVDSGDGGGDTQNYSVGPINQATATILFNADGATPKPAGALDLVFNPDNDPDTSPPSNASPGANNSVAAVAHDHEGRIVIAGNFSAYNATTRNRIARVLPDGMLDESFNPAGGANDFVSSVAVYTHGPMTNKVLVAGGFTAVNGVQRNGIARLNAEDGTLDTSFDPGTGANGPVYAVALQRDGGILIGGDFTVFNGIPRQRLARLTSSGEVDTSFNSGAGANAPVYTIWPVAGNPITITNALTNGVAEMFVRDVPVGATSGFLTLSYNFFAESNNIVVLTGTNILYESGLAAHELITTNQNGGLITNYVPTVVSTEFTAPDGVLRFVVNTLTNAGSNWIFTASIQPDTSEGAYIGGEFTSYNSIPHGRVARLDNNGVADTNFAANSGLGADDTVYALATQRGRLLLGGSFDSFNSFSSRGIAALDEDGSFDQEFAIGSGAEDGDIFSIFVQGDSRILIGGNFTSFNQTRRAFLARLLPNGPLDTSFMDPAYNQYAGFPNPTGFAPSGAINSISVDTNGHVVVGGIFNRVGGGTSRVDFRPRNNLARLVGGSTPGPGNIDLLQPQFGADENAGSLSLLFRRLNGSLGPASIQVETIDGGATAGVDYMPLTNNAVRWLPTGPQQVDAASGNRIQPVVILDDELVEGNENFLVLLSSPMTQLTLGGEFIPTGVALGEITSGRGLIVENDVPAATLGFSATEFDVNESDGQVTISVVRSGDLSSSVSVRYATVASTNAGFARVGEDYTAASGTLSFTSGQTIRSFTISLTDDALVEQDEIVDVILSNPSVGATLGTNSTARLNIIDNDYAPGRVSFAQTNYTVTEGDQVTLSVRRTGGNVGVLRVNYSTFNGTATVPFDFQESSGSLQWDDGDTSARTITVETMEDGLVEGSKDFSVRLFGSPALGLRTNATVTIFDNDSIGSFSFNAAEFLADENGTNVVIHVVRSGGSADLATVDYSTVALSAVPGEDYEDVSGTLIFGMGETSKSFIIPVLDDEVADGEKQVSLVISNPQPVGASLGLLTNAVLAIIDNESLNIPAGSVETDFSVSLGANDAIHALALRADGKFYVGGDFTLVNQRSRTRLALLNSDGTLDPNFGPEYSINGPVRAMDLLEDGRVIIAGAFTEVDSSPTRYLARITAGGNLDQTFNIGSGADNPIFVVKEVAIGQGKGVLVGGSFSMFNGIPRRGIARVTPDGRADAAFNPGAGVNGTVLAIHVQHDGRILIGGEFTSVDGVSRINVARLNPDGSLDRSFDAGLGADGSVQTIAIQFDGRILLGGLFTSVGGVDRRHIARIFPDGTLDSSFKPGFGADGAIYAVGLQPDGKILLAGDFRVFNNTPLNRIVRLNPDGSIDTGINFGLGANAFVRALAIQPDRRILIAGGFTQVDGQPRGRYARLYGGSISGSGRIEFAQPVFSISESATNVSIRVRRIGGLEGVVSVEYLTRPNTALPSVDYTDVRGTLTFSSGQNSRTFLIPLIDDDLAEPNEFVDLVLTNVLGGATLGNQPVAMVAIVSDDSLVGFSDVAYSVNEGTPGGRVLIHISREGDTSRPASVTFSATSGTAIAGQDFVGLTTDLVFAEGEALISVTVQVLNDSNVEDSESIVLRLSSPGPNTSIGRAAATLTILDDDFAPGILDVEQIIPATESSGSIVATVTRRSGRTGFVSVDYSLRNGTATAGADFEGASGTLFFQDGETVKSVTINLFDDESIEGNEIFFFDISNPANGAQIGISSGTAIILDDDLPSGSVDTTFNPGSGPNGPVRTLKFAHSNRLLIGGEFTAVNGVARSRVARLNPNGALDSTFSAEPGPNGLVTDLELVPDGRILLAGNFNSVQNALLNRVARLNPGGTLDLTFALPLGFNATVSDAVLQPDGRIVLGGMFDVASAAGRNHIARIRADGTLDLEFNPGLGANNNVAAVALQEGKTLIAGSFTTVNGVQKQGIARLHSDGAIDTSFNRNGAGVNGNVTGMLVLNDGRVLLGGTFTSYNSTERNGLALIDRDGNLQSTFNPGGGPSGPVYAFAQQEDGKFIVGGDFTDFAGQPRGRIARVNANGTLDATFAPGIGLNGAVRALLIQPADGKVVVGGSFTMVDNEVRPFIARLNNDRAFVQNRPVTFTPIIRNGSELRLTINTQPGFTYTIESSESLSGGWTLHQSIVAESTTVTFSATPSELRRFFRVRRE